MILKNIQWYKNIHNAEKSCLKDDKIKKIHYKFQDGKEMVEEYNIDTKVLLRKAWKLKSTLGGDGKWEVEIGDPIPDINTQGDNAEIMECKDQPIITRRNTRINLEWRIRNLPYSIETYSVTADNNNNNITIRTSNKKFFKRLEVPELARLNITIEQSMITFTHKFNTLIISYKKPQQLLDFETKWYEELAQVKPIKDIPNDCKMQ